MSYHESIFIRVRVSNNNHSCVFINSPVFRAIFLGLFVCRLLSIWSFYPTGQPCPIFIQSKEIFDVTYLEFVVDLEIVDLIFKI